MDTKPKSNHSEEYVNVMVNAQVREPGVNYGFELANLGDGKDVEMDLEM